MRILLVSWEYPPLIYGGLGRHVHKLAESLAASGHDVTVLTQHHAKASHDSYQHGVRIVRVVPDPPATTAPKNLVPWVLAFNTSLIRTGVDLLRTWQPDIIHAHDWLTAHASITLAHAAERPLITTMHATEAGLWNGRITSDVSRSRHDIEAWLITTSTQIIVCSEAMRVEVSAAFNIPPDQLSVIPNGIDPADWAPPPSAIRQARRILGVSEAVPLAIIAGRLEWEKGCDVAIDALVKVRSQHSALQLVVAGVGSKHDALRQQAKKLGVDHAVHFIGQCDQPELARFLAAADIALVPSSYEPFGIVALEANAAGTPVIAGDSGGLRETIHDGSTGLLVPPRDPEALSQALMWLLDHPDQGRRFVAEAAERARKEFDWATIADTTSDVYTKAHY